MKKKLWIFILIILWAGLSIRSLFWSQNKENNNSSKQDNSIITNKTKTDKENQNNSDSISDILKDLENKWNKNLTWNHKTEDKYTEINILIPEYFYNTELQKFSEDLYKEQNIYSKFQFLNNIQEYKDTIINHKYKNIDLILLPYERVNSKDFRNFEFTSSIASAFDPFIFDIVKEDRINFLPYSADPMITYSLSGILEESSFSNIYKSINNRTPSKAMSLPLFFGLTDDDYSNKGFNREYKDELRNNLMKFFEKYKDSNALELRINSNESRTYNLKDISTITDIIYPQVPYCSDFPSICLQLYKFIGIRFWFLSDWDIVDKYFNTKNIDFSEITKMEMPFYWIYNPVRIRGRSIPKEQTNDKIINATYMFLWKYMNDHNKYNLQKHTLPVFADSTDKLENSIFVWNKWEIIYSNWYYIKELQWNKKFWELLENQISAKEYLK